MTESNDRSRRHLRVISYTVVQRTQELGVRTALGASGGAIVRLVLADGLVLTAVGLAIGLADALAVTRLLAALPFGVGARSVDARGGRSSAAGGDGFASYIEAGRAARLDLIAALRTE